MKEYLDIGLSTENSLINEDNDKYKDLFNKYKNENNIISNEGLYHSLNESGKKITLSETNDLIKKVNGDNDNMQINYNNFIKIVESVPENNINIVNEKKTMSNIMIFLFIFLMILGGIIATIFNKIQSKTNSLGILFEVHKKFMIFCMFIGEFICLIVYAIKEAFFKLKNNPEYENLNVNEETREKKQPKIWYFLIPAILDFLANFINIFVSILLTLSVYQTLQSSIIIFTVIASIIILKSKYYKHHYLGLCLVIIGLIINGLTEDNSGENKVFGIFLIILSQLLSSIFYIIEEKLLKTYDISPLKFVGLEGMWGSIISLVFLIIFQLISCDNWNESIQKDICSINDEFISHFEDSIFAIRQMIENINLILFMLGYIVGIILFNYSRLTLYRNRSAIFVLIINNCFSFIIWILFIIIPFNSNNTNDKFSWLKIFGFIFLIFGFIIFSEILVLPFFGFEDNTQKAIKKRQEKSKENSLNDMKILNNYND